MPNPDGQGLETQFAEAADWLIQCLKDVCEHKVVRGLPEAEGAYLQARAALAAREEPQDDQRAIQAAAEALRGIYPNEFADNFYFYQQAKGVIDAYLAASARKRSVELGL
jgi:hypothetical protein